MQSVRFEQVKVGQELPGLDIPLTTSLIVSTALASRDFTPVHHDKSAAQRSGVDDVFMNILTTNGLVGRFVTDWAGPDARITSVAIRLGTPNLPGDTMKLRGTVKSLDAAASTAEVEVKGANAWGNHVTGTVVVELPQAREARAQRGEAERSTDLEKR
ncbi:MAG: acyl dehydratase [Deltaproteobacteria bacterium]|nr:MAG: acyl dehydratase [Deltaproteobacteria bacterium]